MPKLEILLEQVVTGKINLLCICEVKLQTKHLEEVRSLIESNKLSYRMTTTDQRSSRGVLIIWKTEEFPFQVTKTWTDTDKRVVSIELQAGKGIKLTLTCGYFENINAGEETH